MQHILLLLTVAVTSNVVCGFILPHRILSSRLLTKGVPSVMRMSTSEEQPEAPLDPSTMSPDELAEAEKYIEQYLGNAKEKVQETFKEKAMKTVDKILIAQHQAKGHEIYRKFPFDHLKLPILQDCNNYYSGSFQGRFWHQNADQVYFCIPVSDKLKTKEVEINFEPKKVQIKVRGEEALSFEFFDNIIADGSFWMFESDQFGMKYILLDMEKRYRMVNWNSLLAGIVDQDATRNAVLMEQMMNNQHLADKAAFGEDDEEEGEETGGKAAPSRAFRNEEDDLDDDDDGNREVDVKEDDVSMGFGGEGGNRFSLEELRRFAASSNGKSEPFGSDPDNGSEALHTISDYEVMEEEDAIEKLTFDNPEDVQQPAKSLAEVAAEATTLTVGTESEDNDSTHQSNSDNNVIDATIV